MSRLPRSAFLLSLVLALTACGGGGGGSSGGASVTTYTRVARSALPVGDTTCPAGGILVQTGFDANRNLVLDASEVVDSEKVCNGVAGTAAVGALVKITTLSPGGLCVAGGFQVDAGLDANHDSVLGATEISQTSWACNGAAGSNGTNGSNGSNGTNGLTTLVDVTTQGASATCPAGGNRIDVGLDADGNGVLAPGEVMKWTLVCNGVNGTNGTSGLTSLLDINAEAPGANCATGGQKVQTGLDANGNSILDAGEISATRYICNGAAASNGLTSLIAVSAEAAGANCASGGKRIDTGLDDSRDGVLQAGEIDSTSYMCNGTNGTNGLNSLVSISTEPAGVHCAAGGSRIDAGLDDNRDGVLQPAEVDSTSYVCSNNAPTLFASESRPDLCLHGATVLKSGLDLDFSGVLDPAEVLSSTTICQNNASPSFWLRDASYFGPPSTYDAATHTFSVSVYNNASGALRYISDDANGDAVTITPTAEPQVGYDLFDPSTVFAPGDAAYGGEAGLGVQLLAGKTPGTYDVPVNVTDGEASTGYTLHLDVHAPAWTFTPYVAHEGVDTQAGGMVSFAGPLLMDLALESYTPDAEICLGADPCQPLTTSYNSCTWDPGLGMDVCTPVYIPVPTTIPAGTTAFTVRRPIASDNLWGTSNGLSIDMALAVANSPYGFPPMTAYLTVIDDDAAPTASFTASLLSIGSGLQGSVGVQSTQANVLIPVVYSGSAANGVDYSATQWVSIDGTGNGTLLIDALLNESLTADLLFSVALDASYGLVAGAIPSVDVTITPPPPLTVQFAAATVPASRYDGFACTRMQLNRMSYIQDVTVDYTVGGTAVPTVDYLDNNPAGDPVIIPAGSTYADVCYSLPGNENALDVTVVSTITGAAGAAVGGTAASTIDLAGGSLPAADFAAGTVTGLGDPAVDSACTDVTLSGIDAPYNMTVLMRVTPSVPGLAGYLANSGFFDQGDGSWARNLMFGAHGSRIEQLCISRPAGYATLPVGDYTLTVAIESVEYGHVGTTHASTTFDIHQTFGSRYLVPQVDSGTYYGIQQTAASEHGAFVGVGAINGVLAGGTQAGGVDLFVVHVAADGTTWTRQFGTPNEDNIQSVVIDDAGNAAVLDSWYGIFGGSGMQLVRYTADGTPSFSQPVSSDTSLLAMRNGQVLLAPLAAQTLVALDAAGATAWTLTPADFGLTACAGNVQFEAMPVQGSNDFYVRARAPSMFGCTIADADSDGYSFGDQVLARVSGAGVVLWRIDDAHEVGISTLPADLRSTEDAGGNLYLLDRFGNNGHVLKVAAGGTLPWAATGPACTSTHTLLDHGTIDVSPAGKVAVGWVVDCTYNGQAPLGAGDVAYWTIDTDGTTLDARRFGGAGADAAQWILARGTGAVYALVNRGWPDFDINVWSLDAGVANILLPNYEATTTPTRLLDGSVLMYSQNLSTVRLYDASLNPR